MNNLLQRISLILLMIISTILFIAPTFAQEALPTSTYFYYGRQVTLDEISQIATHRFQEIGTYIDCVYVSEADDNPSTADYHQEFECFNTPNEARQFIQQLRLAGYIDSFEQLSDVEVQTNCPYWAVYSQSFHIATSLTGSICTGQSIAVSVGIWSVWDGASNDIRLSDNPGYPGLRWTFSSTQYTLSAGPGGSRQAYHCETSGC